MPFSIWGIYANPCKKSILAERRQDAENSRKIGVPEGLEVYYGIALDYKAKDLHASPPTRKYQTYYSIIC